MRIISLTILGLAVLFQSKAQSEYCGVGTIWDAESQTCIVAENVELLDSNLDGVVGVADLLNLLSHFGDEDMDFDGIYDSVDDCVGSYDECGVCNGPGPDVPVVETIELFFDSVYIDQIDSWYVFQTGADTTFSYVCATAGCTDATAGNFNPDALIDDGSCTYGPEQCGGVSTVTYDGYTYDLVAIGEQCWFKANLRTTTYSDGSSVPEVQGGAEWGALSTGAQASYGNHIGNGGVHGRLYNWYAVDDERGLCPSGWHVPTDGEYTELIDYLGGTYVAGGQMKSSPSDSPSWDGSNSSGFSALPSGGRYFYAGFYLFLDLLDYAYFWSSSGSGSSAWGRRVGSGNDPVNRSYYNGRNGFSVRCVRDEQ